MRILAIDPGSTESGWVIIDADTCRPIEFGKSPNAHLLESCQYGVAGRGIDMAVIEMVASYGMAVGADVFETCVWIGRFLQVLSDELPDEPKLVKRHPIKLHVCHSAKANDANIRQALVDRFAHGEPNYGKGTKARPGFFHGFSKDVWQAFALAVYAADVLARRQS